MNTIQHMNLAGLDLNLLVVFDALLSEGHVTRAGQRLGLSQPATSHALARLRHLTGDPLFLRTPQGLQPTPKALALSTTLRPALHAIQATLLEAPPFDPSQSQRVFAIGMSDYVEFTVLPTLMRHLQSVAPGVGIHIRSGERAKLLALLDKGDIDVACGVFPENVPWHHAQILFEETYVGVCRDPHPTLPNPVDLDAFVAASHLLISIQEDRQGRVDTWLAEHQRSRHIALSLPHFLIAPFVLAQTNLIATLGSRIAHAFAQHQSLRLFPLPVPITGFAVTLRWHQSHQSDPAQSWLRTQLLQVCQSV
ncbi:MAG: LysR family transcriptional regulator [Synechococcales cyanobacterium]